MIQPFSSTVFCDHHKTFKTPAKSRSKFVCHFYTEILQRSQKQDRKTPQKAASPERASLVGLHTFATVLPSRVNWPIIRSFLAPMMPLGVTLTFVEMWLNDDLLTEELVECHNGFFAHITGEALPSEARFHYTFRPRNWDRPCHPTTCPQSRALHPLASLLLQSPLLHFWLWLWLRRWPVHWSDLRATWQHGHRSALWNPF